MLLKPSQPFTPLEAPVSGAAPKARDDEGCFLDAAERELGERFLRDGHVILPVEDADGLRRIRDRITALAAAALERPMPRDPGDFLNRLHLGVDGPALNHIRMAVIGGINAEPWLRRTYFGLARQALGALVGNELVMQRRINLSIQLPRDESSLLPVHADVWDGDSPYEVVVWLPLVDCYHTKSMFLLPPAAAAEVEAEFGRFAGRSTEDLFRAIKPRLVWLDVPFGHVLLFSQNLMHGNRVNREPETRWSMNCRFKSLFSPYAAKRLGEFFEPITLRPATRLGLDHRFPEGFDE